MIDPVNEDQKRPQRLQLEIPFATIVKVLASTLLVYMVVALVPLIMTIYLAALLAVTLYPLLAMLRRRRLPSWIGIMHLAGGLSR